MYYVADKYSNRQALKKCELCLALCQSKFYWNISIIGHTLQKQKSQAHLHVLLFLLFSAQATQFLRLF